MKDTKPCGYIFFSKKKNFIFCLKHTAKLEEFSSEYLVTYWLDSTTNVFLS